MRPLQLRFIDTSGIIHEYFYHKQPQENWRHTMQFKRKQNCRQFVQYSRRFSVIRIKFAIKLEKLSVKILYDCAILQTGNMCTRRKPVSNLIYIQDLKVGHVSNRTTPDVVRERIPKVAYRYYVHGLRSRNDVSTCFPIQSCFINHLGKI